MEGKAEKRTVGLNLGLSRLDHQQMRTDAKAQYIPLVSVLMQEPSASWGR
jgi:hypothetical protein